MTMIEQIALANEKVAHWNSKRDHALAMLSKWQSRLSTLQAKGKPVPTAAKLPTLTIVPDSVKFMPRQAVVTKSDRAQAEYHAKETALADIAEETGSDSIKTKTRAVVRTDEGDYRWRTTLPREAVAARIAEAVEAISYEKVKPSVAEERQQAYFRAWCILMDVQAWT